MGKIDDLRKQRELRFAEMQRRAKAQLSSANANGTAAPHPHPADSPVPASPEPVSQEKSPPAVGRERADRTKKSQLKPKSTFRSKSKPRTDVPLQGKCRVCGKIRALGNGLLVNHQKGLGKPCPGSRKKPAGA